MKRIILGIFLSVLIIFNIQTSFGYSVTFEEWGTKIQNTPTVCILEPSYENDKYLTEVFVKRLMDESRIAIDEWEVLLKQSERTRDKSMWEINQIELSLEEQKDFDYQECNVFIHFQDIPELEEDWFKVLGKTRYEQEDTGRSEITIYYAGIDLCKTEDEKFIYYDPCFSDSHRLLQQLSSAVKHEFGHALGLGHYVADDIQINIDWARGVINAPSIMSVFTHQNVNENRITPKDIDKVRTLYGEEGFFHNITIEKNTFKLFESSQEEFIIPKGGFQIASIEGLIYSERLISGVPVILEITGPDGNVVFIDIKVNSKGDFNFQKTIDSSVTNGTYFAIASYRGEKSNEITFNIIKDTAINDTNELSQIPQWLKNNAKVYGDGQIMDRDFILGIKYLVERGFIGIPDEILQELDTIKEDSTKNPEFPVASPADPQKSITILSDDSPCREGYVLVYRFVHHDTLCATPSTANSWEELGLAEIVASANVTNDVQESVSEEELFMEIPDGTKQTENQESVIPEWVRDTAKWWSEDQISDEEFTNEIKYLIENGIIKI